MPLPNSGTVQREPVQRPDSYLKLGGDPFPSDVLRVWSGNPGCVEDLLRATEPLAFFPRIPVSESTPLQ
jgi:hypothetical protein